MAWYLFIRNNDGDLVSEGSVVPEGIDTGVYEVRDVGTRPDWTVKAWNRAQRVLFDKPLPILIDRLDDIQARFLADADFLAVWDSLNASRKTQLRQGIMRVLASMLRSLRFRQEDEQAELD